MEREEGFICRTGRHWAIFLGPIVVLAIGCLMIASRRSDAVAVLAFGLAWSMASYLSYKRSRIVLTRKALSIYAGFPFGKSYDIPLDQMEDVQFYQPTLGSILDFGKIVFARRGKHSFAVRFVSSPAVFAAEVRREMLSAGHPDEQYEGKKDAGALCPP